MVQDLARQQVHAEVHPDERWLPANLLLAGARGQQPSRHPGGPVGRARGDARTAPAPSGTGAAGRRLGQPGARLPHRPAGAAHPGADRRAPPRPGPRPGRARARGPGPDRVVRTAPSSSTAPAAGGCSARAEGAGDDPVAGCGPHAEADLRAALRAPARRRPGAARRLRPRARRGRRVRGAGGIPRRARAAGRLRRCWSIRGTGRCPTGRSTARPCTTRSWVGWPASDCGPDRDRHARPHLVGPRLGHGRARGAAGGHGPAARRPALPPAPARSAALVAGVRRRPGAGLAPAPRPPARPLAAPDDPRRAGPGAARGRVARPRGVRRPPGRARRRAGGRGRRRCACWRPTTTAGGSRLSAARSGDRVPDRAGGRLLLVSRRHRPRDDFDERRRGRPRPHADRRLGAEPRRRAPGPRPGRRRGRPDRCPVGGARALGTFWPIGLARGGPAHPPPALRHPGERFADALQEHAQGGGVVARAWSWLRGRGSSCERGPLGLATLLVLFGVVAFGAVVPVLPTGAAVSSAAVLARSDHAWRCCWSSRSARWRRASATW